ncbi:hypothetical protein LX36DRAFT_658485 [Colletotrichum falcatum]|nr:hypothetical protein LX36DRAFT_658485 [Colletotrichum falcatum]
MRAWKHVWLALLEFATLVQACSVVAHIHLRPDPSLSGQCCRRPRRRFCHILSYLTGRCRSIEWLSTAEADNASSCGKGHGPASDWRSLPSGEFS